MATILFLAHRIPYPPNKGDKIRAWHFLSHLLSKHTVHLGFYVDDKKDLAHIDYLEGLTSSLCYQEVVPFMQKVRSLSGFVTGKSLTEQAYPQSKLKSYSNALLESGEIDLVFLYSAATAPLVPATCQTPVIADLVDVDSQKWASYATGARWPLSYVYNREATKLGALERDIAEASSATLLVSQQEADLFTKLNAGCAGKVKAISNGVDLTHFDATPKGTGANRTAGDDTLVLFTGAMDYQPNIEAVVWFCEHVWPRIRAKAPQANFRIAGGPTTPQVDALAATEGVEVVGYVDNMAEEIAKATVSVAPLRLARGIQNKVLEAMAMSKPVVATSLANEGINADHDTTILVHDDAAAFADAVLTVLRDKATGERLGQAARTFVEENFTWGASYQQLDGLIDELL
ncbi:MAG: TIGR03087 family PEP-CTERM/XrtA system glycosyltransferase [Kordiimonadaceae bacterium]|nr:TIGR03087 family PEP-CTERM/XrtA system glycosyltransferase [Kordiimonadaceae bacterium]